MFSGRVIHSFAQAKHILSEIEGGQKPSIETQFSIASCLQNALFITVFYPLSLIVTNGFDCRLIYMTYIQLLFLFLLFHMSTTKLHISICISLKGGAVA